MQDLMKSVETQRVKAENGEETSNDPKVSNCQIQGNEVGSEESKKLETTHEAVAGDMNVESDLMILKNDNEGRAVADSADTAAVPAAAAANSSAADVNHSAKEGLQDVTAKSDENDGKKTAKSSQELSAVTESLPFTEGIKKLSSDTAVEMSSSEASDFSKAIVNLYSKG